MRRILRSRRPPTLLRGAVLSIERWEKEWKESGYEG
jgi:hypothetical protein